MQTATLTVTLKVAITVALTVMLTTMLTVVLTVTLTAALKVALGRDHGDVAVGCRDVILPAGGVIFSVLLMVASELAFMLQGKSIPHICYELFLLPKRPYIYIFSHCSLKFMAFI